MKKFMMLTLILLFVTATDAQTDECAIPGKTMQKTGLRTDPLISASGSNRLGDKKI